MQRPRTPLELIKKKIYPEAIMYKFRWSNGSISLEPLPELSYETLLLVQSYELQCTKKLIGNERTPVIIEKSKASETYAKQIERATKQIEQSPQLPEIAPQAIEKAPTTMKKALQKKPKIVENPCKEMEDDPQSIGKFSEVIELNPPVEVGCDESQLPAEKPVRKDKRSCDVVSVRQAPNGIQFQIVFKDDRSKRKYWKDVEQLKKIAPISLCDYLLEKISISYDNYQIQKQQQLEESQYQ